MKRAGERAPDFALCDAQGREVRLSDFRGKRVVLYFYPKDDTPGCTAQACGLRDAYDAFVRHGAVVLGVSADDAASHAAFGQKYRLPFALLSDPQREAIDAYSVWGEKRGGRMGILRTTFLIGPDGTIERVWEQVRPEQHAQEILQALS